MLSNKELSTEQIKDLFILGSLIEIFNSAYLIWDDIMDKSETRRGKPCWYRQDRVDMMAINDACLLLSIIRVVLRKHFRAHPAYDELVELFSEASFRTELGQHYDLMAAEGLLKVVQFTWSQYEFITANKTAYYTFYVPIMIPILYLGLTTPKNTAKIYDLSMMFGLMFQARDDFLDVYGDATVTGKTGSDIRENKCTWLSVKANEHCNPSQKATLESCYGSQRAEDIQKVRQLFDQLYLPELFLKWDQEMQAKMDLAIKGATNDEGLKGDIFREFLSKYFADPRRSICRLGQGSQ